MQLKVTAILIASLLTFQIQAQLPNVGVLANINPGTNSGSPSNMIKLGSTIIFSANDGTNGTELWKTDGTLAGTVMVKNINATGNSSPSNFVIMGGFVYFTANDGVVGGALWRTDGTNAGTTLVKDINAATTSSPFITELTAIGSKLYFRGEDANGIEPWISDGTSAGTVMLKDIRPGAGSSSGFSCTDCGGTYEFVEFGGKVYFNANDGNNSFGQNSELWRTDGTTAGTVLFIDNYSFGSGAPANLVNAGSYLFFTSDNQSLTGYEPWKTDGTVAGTSMIRDIFNPGFNAGSITGDVPTVFMNGYVYFVAVDNYTASPPPGISFYNNAELWRTDGTFAGTTKVKEINTNTTPGSNDANPINFFVNGTTLYFQATDFTNGTEVWKTDGTNAGTVMVGNINPGGNANPSNFYLHNSFIYFSANDGTNGTELWRTNGSTAELVKNMNPGSSSGSPGNMVSLDATHMLFRGNTGTAAGGLGSEMMLLGGNLISVTTSANGIVTPPGAGSASSTIEMALLNNGSLTFNFTPDPTYSVQSVVVNGSNVGTPTSRTFSNVTTNQTLNVTFGIGGPSCPTFSGAPAEVSIVNSTCTSGCTPGGGTITAPGGTPCPAGSSIQYQVNNGAWSGTLPMYAQNGPAQNIKTRCSCDADANNVSAASAGVTTNPGTCTTPSASISGTNVICSGGSSTFTASGGGTYIWNTTATTAAITVSTAGTYTVTVTAANGCTATATRTLTVNPLPTPSISGTNVICSGGSSTFTATGGTSYLWNTAATTAAITVSTAGTYTVTVTNANNCTATATRTLTVNPLPTPAISGTNVICSGGSTTFTATGGTSYLWNTAATTAAITVSIAGTYTVTATDANSCSATATRTLTVNPSPTPSISGTNVICSGGSTTFTATGGTTYLWNTAATTAAITVSTAGTYTVTVTDGNTCTATATRTLTVNPLPTPSISGNNLCGSSSTTLTASGGTSYLWNTGATTAALTVSMAGTYTVTATDANGCSASATRTVTTNTLPTVSITGTNVICAGNSTTFTASGGTSYIWNTTATTAAITISTAGTYTVTATDANSCSATATRTLTVNPLPTASISGNNAVCSGASTLFTASGGTSYLWNGGQTTAAITVSTAGTYTVTVTDVNGCTASATKSLVVNSLPAANLSASPNPVCQNTVLTLTAPNAGAGASYAWSGIGTIDNNSNSITAIPLTPGMETYTVTVTDANGCTATGTVSVTVQACTIISGTIVWEQDDITGVKDASVVITGAAGSTLTTDVNGQYSATYVATGNFTITPSKNINLLNGVTSADAMRVQQHLSGMPLTDPYKLVAADVNKSNSITTTDASLISQVILGNPTALAIFNTSWRFVPTSHTMAMPPWGFPTVINLTGVSGIQSNKNFVGIKLGDVNGSANPALFGAAPLVWTTPEQELKTGSVVSVPFTVKHFQQLGAYQFALHFDASRLHFETLVVNPQQSVITIDNFGLFNLASGDIRSAWSSANATDLPDDMVIFTLNFTVSDGGIMLSEALDLDEAAIEADAYLTSGSSVGLDVVYSQTSSVDPEITQNGIRLWQNRPNPTSGYTVIGFETPQPMPFTLNLYDMAGRLIEQRRGQSVTGYQEQTFNINLPAGMVWYELLTPSGILTRKMTITD